MFSLKRGKEGEIEYKISVGMVCGDGESIGIYEEMKIIL